MVAVNVLALVSSVQRLKAHEVVIGAGLRLAIPGLLGAPLGAWIGTYLTGHTLMIVFGIFVGVLAVQMLLMGEPKPSTDADAQRPRLRSLVLIAAGLCTGLLAGLLGAGGVLIVPSLVLLGGLAIHRAIATSLPVIYAISGAAISSHLLGGQTVPIIVAATFVAGGGVGLFAGRALGQRLSGPRLQKVFAFALLAVAVFIRADLRLIGQIARFSGDRGPQNMRSISERLRSRTKEEQAKLRSSPQLHERQSFSHPGIRAHRKRRATSSGYRSERESCNE